MALRPCSVSSTPEPSTPSATWRLTSLPCVAWTAPLRASSVGHVQTPPTSSARPRCPCPSASPLLSLSCPSSPRRTRIPWGYFASARRRQRAEFGFVGLLRFWVRSGLGRSSWRRVARRWRQDWVRSVLRVRHDGAVAGRRRARHGSRPGRGAVPAMELARPRPRLGSPASLAHAKLPRRPSMAVSHPCSPMASGLPQIRSWSSCMLGRGRRRASNPVIPCSTPKQAP
jgi:hypothetical protein